MSKISVELPVKLEELCQFTFNFNNLIKIIDYLHQSNLSLQQNLKDIDKRLICMEELKSDVEDLKIKTINIEKTNENLNRSFSNLQENILKYDSRISEIHNKANDIETKVKKLEIMQNDQIQNLNHLNKVVEENTNNINQINDKLNNNNDNLTKITEKINENEKKNNQQFENIDKNIKEINSNNELNKKEIETINNDIGEINSTIKNIINNVEKKNSDMNNRILNIINDIADINNNILNIYSYNSNNNIKSNNKPEKEINENIINNINKDMNNSNLFKIAMDEIEEEKNKLNKLKEDYEINKEKQKKENNFYKKSINDIIEEFNNLKKEVEENTDNIENIQNNYINYINIKNEGIDNNNKNEKGEKTNKSKEIDLNALNIYLKKYVTLDLFKKLNDNVRILTSAINSKPGREEIETQLKKFNVRLENIEMIQQGQTHGPKTRINLGLVNAPINRVDSSNISNSEEINQLNEIDYITKKIEKKISGNIANIINKDIKNIDFSLNPKINELIINNKKNCEDIDKNNKTIIDIRNILITNPSQNDFIKIKNDIENLEEDCKVNKIKIIDLIKNIEGTEEDCGDDKENILTGTVKDKINFLNKFCQNLNVKLSSFENKNKSINKEIKDEIKQNLKNETIKIMQQFKLRLESFTHKFEHELKNKIDQIGLTDFETKMNNKFNIDLKEKLDKNELKKNNNMIKRKIDNLETKISKTLVDTIIDLQMDEQPLIIKNNANGIDICASCNQYMQKNTIYQSGSSEYVPGKVNKINRVKNMNRSLINFTQPSNNKLTINNDRKTSLNLSIGQNKLPDIIPSLYQK